MSIITHGSDLRLAPTIKPLVAAGDGSVRTALGRAVKLGFAAVQLDATLAGTRPRDLSHRDRRDLAAIFTRHDVQAAGIDVFIPRKHYVEQEHVDRAVAATIAAIELAADLGRIPVSIGLPIADAGEDVKSALAEAADGHSVRLAVHAEDQLEALVAWLAAIDQPTVGAGLDPAALLARSQPVVKTATQLGARLAAARLSDMSDAALRCAPGEGELRLSEYRIALDLASQRSGPVVLDLRGLEEPFAAATRAKAAWEAGAVRF